MHELENRFESFQRNLNVAIKVGQAADSLFEKMHKKPADSASADEIEQAKNASTGQEREFFDVIDKNFEQIGHITGYYDEYGVFPPKHYPIYGVSRDDLRNYASKVASGQYQMFNLSPAACFQWCDIKSCWID